MKKTVAIVWEKGAGRGSIEVTNGRLAKAKFTCGSGAVTDGKFTCTCDDDCRMAVTVEDARVGMGANATIVTVKNRHTPFAFFLRDVHRQTPIYVPTLVSLLHDRQVKHEARETLVALGEPAAPTLAYFLADPDEPIWVRRALPMTLARIGSPAAVEGLLEAGLMTGDAFLRRKVLAAVATLPAHRRGGIEPDAVRGQIRIEASRYLQALADLCSLGLDRHRCPPTGRL